MADLDLRPLSLGEILDRTFSIYRRNFLLFLGITALPQLLVLAINLLPLLFAPVSRTTAQPAADQFQSGAASGWQTFGIFGVIVGIVVGVIVYCVSYLFAQGGTVFAVSELYLGRTTTIGASLRRMRGQLGNLFGVLTLNGLATGAAFLCLVIPGFYVLCRLSTCVPAALLEDMGPRSSLERSFTLTKNFAGRAFVIYLLYGIMLYAAMALFMFPFLFAVGMSAKDPNMLRMWMALTHVGSFLAGVLVGPFLTIATAVFYYDLRVRKEAFDLQFMMNPSGNIPSGTPIVPTMLS
jgi:hypothetical protein